MANRPVPYQSRNVGTSLTAIGGHVVASATNEIVMSVTVANVLGSDTTYNVTINDGTNDFYLVKGAPLYAGTTARVVTGNRMSLTTGYSIKVSGGAASSVDATMSVLEFT